MFNPFKSFKERREHKKNLRRLAKISSAFSLMERLSKSGLIHWDRRHRRLFIAEPLAIVMLAKGAQSWTNFLNNVYQYVVYIHMSELWQNQLTKRQTRAVADARRTRTSLSADEIQRIRRAAMSDLSDEDVSIPQVEAFEFYVVADNKGANPETTFCGTYDPDSDYLDIVLWEDVQAAVSAYHK